MSVHETKCSISLGVSLNKIYNYNIENFIDKHNLFQDSSVKFSQLVDKFLIENFSLMKLNNFNKYFFVKKNSPEIIYQKKIFATEDCRFCLSSIIGKEKTNNIQEFQKKTKELIFIIILNNNLSNIKLLFIRGIDLLKKYPTGIIHISQYNDFLNLFC